MIVEILLGIGSMVLDWWIVAGFIDLGKAIKKLKKDIKNADQAAKQQ